MDRTYCVFGDSVTQASYVTDSWPNQLRTYLEQKSTQDYINFYNLGIGGNTSTDILNRFKTEALVRQPTHLIFAYGVNDASWDTSANKPVVSLKDFKINTVSIIETAKSLTQDIVFISPVFGTLVEESGGWRYTRSRVEEYNTLLKQLVTSAGFTYIDLVNTLADSDFMDRLHPNDSGHSKMFDQIKKYF